MRARKEGLLGKTTPGQAGEKEVGTVAHIRKTGSRWQARYRDPSGREVSRRFDRKVDAEARITTQAAEMLRGTYVDPAAGKVTLGDYAADWMARMRPTWRISTAPGIANSLDHHILPVLGRRPVAGLRRSDVEALCGSLALAPSTVATVHQHLSHSSPMPSTTT